MFSTWHFIWHPVWRFIWHFFLNLSWHSSCHILWLPIWHIFWHSSRHSISRLIWHSIWHIFTFHLAFYLVFIYIYIPSCVFAFYLTCSFCLTLSNILSGTWAGILAGIYYDIPSGIYSDFLSGILSDTDILSGIYFVILLILSGIISNILFDIYFGILSGIYWFSRPIWSSILQLGCVLVRACPDWAGARDRVRACVCPDELAIGLLSVREFLWRELGVWLCAHRDHEQAHGRGRKGKEGRSCTFDKI